MNIRAKALTLAMMALGASGAALAVATPEEIKQLGTTLRHHRGSPADQSM